MKTFTDAKAAAYKAHHSAFECSCEHTNLVKRTVVGGAVQYIAQCRKCGKAVGQAIARKKAIEAADTDEIPDFDDEIARERDRLIEGSLKAIADKFDRKVFFTEYDDYLQSSEWRNLANLVLKRAGGACEGCGKSPPTQVHHLTYAHVGAEFMFELVALCDPCHTRIHAEG